jgi:hypothetical protein
MRHINFDESFVMNEFAKIMTKNDGLVKTAGDNDMAPKTNESSKPAPQQESVKPVETKKNPAQEAKDYVSKFCDELQTPATKELIINGKMINKIGNELSVKSESVPDGKSSMIELSKKIMTIQGSFEVKNAMIALYTKARNILANSIKKFKTNPELLNQLVPDLSPKPQQADDGAVEKTAAAKADALYNVSGETGEDLIDSAHPGKMYTDVNSKTKENLIETVVEQQERDKEVAYSNPTGKYAELTTELTKLANKLDEGGFLDAADKVDELIKKVAVSYDDYINSSVALSNKFLDELLKKNKTYYEGKMIVFPDKIIERLTKLKNHVFKNVEDALPELYKLDTDGTFVQLASNVRSELENEVKDLQIKALSIDTPKTETQTIEKGVESITMPEKVVPKLKWWENPAKVKAFRMKYNNAVEGTKRPKLDLDAPFGKADSDAAVEVYKRGWANFERLMKIEPSTTPQSQQSPGQAKKPQVPTSDLVQKTMSDNINRLSTNVYSRAKSLGSANNVNDVMQLKRDIRDYVMSNVEAAGNLTPEKFESGATIMLDNINKGKYKK